jgi:hypothetical protein
LLWLGVDEAHAESLVRKNMGDPISHCTGANNGDILHGKWGMGGGWWVVTGKWRYYRFGSHPASRPG